MLEVIYKTVHMHFVLKIWKIIMIIPVLKTGDPIECDNYRGISLLDMVYKILLTITKIKLEAVAKTLLGEYQVGFRKGVGIMDQIFTIKELTTTCYERITVYFICYRLQS